MEEKLRTLRLEFAAESGRLLGKGAEIFNEGRHWNSPGGRVLGNSLNCQVPLILL